MRGGGQGDFESFEDLTLLIEFSLIISFSRSWSLSCEGPCLLVRNPQESNASANFVGQRSKQRGMPIPSSNCTPTSRSSSPPQLRQEAKTGSTAAGGFVQRLIEDRRGTDESGVWGSGAFQAAFAGVCNLT